MKQFHEVNFFKESRLAVTEDSPFITLKFKALVKKTVTLK